MHHTFVSRLPNNTHASIQTVLLCLPYTPLTSTNMACKHNSSAANRLAKQLEHFIAMNYISITDSISLSEAGPTTIVRFYKNHKHKNEKYSITYNTKTIIKLLRGFYNEVLGYPEFNIDSDTNSRVAFRKLLRILPITDPRFKPLINNIKRSEYRTPRFKSNYHTIRQGD